MCLTAGLGSIGWADKTALAVLNPGALCWEFWLAALICTGATIEDLARRTISNWFCVSALLAGGVLHWYGRGWRGLAVSLLGAGVGFALFLISHVLGGMGGGDVKLMGGLGALLGWDRIWLAVFLTAVAGAVGAAAVALPGVVRRRISGAGRQPMAVPYAPAIAAGTMLALWSRPH